MEAESSRARPHWRRLLAGALLAALLAAAGVVGWLVLAEPEPAPIHVTAEVRAQIAAALTRQTGRPPEASALAAATDAWVRREVLGREARAIGLGTDESSTAERATMMEARLAAPARAADPGDAGLEAYARRHARRYAAAHTLSLDVVRFSARSRAVVGEVLIGGGARWDKLGDAPPTPPAVTFGTVPGKQLADRYGPSFAAAVVALAPGPQWHGPIEGGSGWYLVRVARNNPAALPLLARQRDRVLADWRRDWARELGDAGYRAIRARTPVVIDP